jgi:hypothetical protein
MNHLTACDAYTCIRISLILDNYRVTDCYRSSLFETDDIYCVFKPCVTGRVSIWVTVCRMGHSIVGMSQCAVDLVILVIDTIGDGNQILPSRCGES